MASDKLEKAYREDLVADVKKGIGITEVPDKVVRLDSIPFTELSEAYPTGFKQLDDKFLGGFRGGNLVLISGYSGNGKCHGKGTKILMFDGSIKNVEDIIVGDQLMGDDNNPRNVLSLADGQEQLYEVSSKYNKTEPYTVNESHILSLWCGNKQYGKQGIKDISIKDYLKRDKWFKYFHYGYKVPVEFKEKELPVDPYFIGLWLGDGHTASSRVTTMDNEIVNYLNNYADKLRLQVTKTFIKNNKANTYGITRGNRIGGSLEYSLQKKLRLLNILNNKHIPEIYKVNSKENRLKLLAGLIDSDGSKNCNGYDYVTKLEGLADDIVFLCRSLGLQAKKRIKYNKKYDKNYYRISIHGELSEIPVLLLRKKCHKRIQIKNILHYSIDVKKLGIGDYYGFELDGNHRYLLGDFTVTHNTTLSLQITQNYSKLVIPVMWFTYEMPINELQWKLDQMGGYKGLNLFVPKIHTTGDINWLKKKVLEGIVLHNSKVIVIDNLDFLTINSGEDKLTMQKKIVGMLKGIAIEYDVIVFLNVHITKIEEGKEPRMQNIYGASETYKLADAVIFIHRIKEEVGRGEQSLNYTKISKIIVDKNRLKGILGTFELEFKNNRFEELTPEVNYVNKALNKANGGEDRNRRISC